MTQKQRLMLQINEDLRIICTDGMNYIHQQRKISPAVVNKKPNPKAGTATWKNTGYHPTLELALVGQQAAFHHHISNFCTINIKNIKKEFMKTIIKEELNQNYLKILLHYDELTGIFTWKERPVELFKPGKYQLNACNSWNTKFSNKEAGSIWTEEKSKTSYLRIGIKINGKPKQYRAHRLVILYTDGHLPPEQVDHIDGNGLNNKRINLREVTDQENNKNMPMRSDNKSGTVGVRWHKPAQKWTVQIRVDGKQIHGGCFTNLEDAIAKREAMEIEHDYHKNHGRN